jgi:hypothetical protein
MISSCVEIDVRVSAAANRVVDEQGVLIGPCIRNTENLNLYPPAVSSEILSPQWFRSIDHPIDETEQRIAFILIQRYPSLAVGSLPLGYSSAVTDNIFEGNSHG